MKNFYLETNTLKDPKGEMTAKVAAFLTSHGCRVVPTYEDADCILVLGGDGTVLRTAGKSFGSGVPLLGINLGHLGYLAQIEASSWEEDLLKVIEGHYDIEERMMLSAVTGGKKMHALNDVVISRNGPLRTIRYGVYVGEQFVHTFHADGIILSTPTGSTAYNLSAGGPICTPGSSMIVLTPICPQTLNIRSIVFGGSEVIRIEIGFSQGSDDPGATASFDGRGDILLHGGDVIEVHKSSKTTKLVRISDLSFLETLHRKMEDLK